MGAKERQLTESGYAPEFSPDGKSIAYRTASLGTKSVWVIPAAGGVPRKIYDTENALAGPVWSPDGKKLLICEGRSYIGIVGAAVWLLLPVDGGKPVPVRGMEKVQKMSRLPYPKIWLADGGRVIFGNWQRESHICYVRMSNDGEVLGSPVQVTYGTREHPGPSSYDGRVIPFSTGFNVTTIYALPMDAAQGVVKGDPKPVLQWDSDAMFPTVSRDGSKMVFVANREGDYDLWYRDMKTGAERPLLASPNRESRGIISPDGTKVAFQRHEKGEGNCYWMPLPSGPETMIRRGCKGLSSWTPDSTGIICSGGQPPVFEIHNVDTGAKSPTASHPKYRLGGFSVSPDGKWLVFVRNKAGSNPQQVFVAPRYADRSPGENEWRPVSTEGYIARPLWSPDGNAIYYFQFDAAAGRFQCLMMRRLSPDSKRPAGEPVTVRHFHGEVRPSVGEAGPALLADTLYLPMYEPGGQIWVAERTN
ncbi:MAG: TolB family protein [Bryobacteraceae bacterium]